MFCKIMSIKIIVILLLSTNLHSAAKRKHATIDISELIYASLKNETNPKALVWYIEGKVFAMNYNAFHSYYNDKQGSTSKLTSIKNQLTRSKSGCIALGRMPPEGYDKLYTHKDWIVVRGKHQKKISEEEIIDKAVADVEEECRKYKFSVDIKNRYSKVNNNTNNAGMGYNYSTSTPSEIAVLPNLNLMNNNYTNNVGMGYNYSTSTPSEIAVLPNLNLMNNNYTNNVGMGYNYSTSTPNEIAVPPNNLMNNNYTNNVGMGYNYSTSTPSEIAVLPNLNLMNNNYTNNVGMGYNYSTSTPSEIAVPPNLNLMNNNYTNNVGMGYNYSTSTPSEIAVPPNNLMNNNYTNNVEIGYAPRSLSVASENMPNLSHSYYYKSMLEEELNYLCYDKDCPISDFIAKIKTLTRGIIDIDDNNLRYILSIFNNNDVTAPVITKDKLRDWLWFFGPLNQLPVHLSYFINEGRLYFQKFNLPQDNLPDNYFSVWPYHYQNDDPQNIIVANIIIKINDEFYPIYILKDYTHNLYYYYQKNHNKKTIEKKEYASLKEAINSLVKIDNNFKYTPFDDNDIGENLTIIKSILVPKSKVKPYIVPLDKL